MHTHSGRDQETADGEVRSSPNVQAFAAKRFAKSVLLGNMGTSPQQQPCSPSGRPGEIWCKTVIDKANCASWVDYPKQKIVIHVQYRNDTNEAQSRLICFIMRIHIPSVCLLLFLGYLSPPSTQVIWCCMFDSIITCSLELSTFDIQCWYSFCTWPASEILAILNAGGLRNWRAMHQKLSLDVCHGQLFLSGIQWDEGQGVSDNPA